MIDPTEPTPRLRPRRPVATVSVVPARPGYHPPGVVRAEITCPHGADFVQHVAHWDGAANRVDPTAPTFSEAINLALMSLGEMSRPFPTCGCWDALVYRYGLTHAATRTPALCVN